MTFTGHVLEGKIVFDEPLPLPDGVPVRVEAIVPKRVMPPPPGSSMREVLDWIAANRIQTLPPGTPDSVEMLREDRER